MATVSVGQIENLEIVVSDLQANNNLLEEVCKSKIVVAENKLEEVQKEVNNSSNLLETSIEKEMKKQIELEYAHRKLLETHNRLASAEEIVSKAETAFELAKGNRMQMERRLELANQCLSIATQLLETVQTECSIRLQKTSNLVEEGTLRLKQASEALNGYLETNQPATDFNSWLNWAPKKNVPITPKELNSRLNLSNQQLRHFGEYLTERNPLFRAKIADYRRQLNISKGSAERHAIQSKIRSNMSGAFGESIVEYALKPLGNKSNTQARMTFKDGRYTKTDLIIEDIKAPVILGRGEGMSTPIGGDIAVEVKCGKAAYLYSQKDHMVFQSKGHQASTASMTICSRDIKDLTPEKEKEIREALRQAGSPLIGMLPNKEEIDKICWELVTNKKRGDNED